MTSLKLSEEKFLSDVKDHKMQIVCDQGVNRNIVFKIPDSSHYHFILTTWHGYLCISGDMGTFVFQRTSDMFSFFRIDKNDFNFSKDKKLNINAGYWSEKLEAEDKRIKSEKFSEEVFIEELKSRLNSFCSEMEIYEDEEETVQDRQQKIWESLESAASNVSSEEEAYSFILTDPSWPDSRDDEAFAEYLQQDPDFGNFNDYTHHFIWCLYAIVWGIKKYDEYKELLEKETSTHISDTFALGIASINRADC